MPKVIFYDLNRIPKMTWDDIRCLTDEKGCVLQFAVWIETTLFNVSTTCKVEKGKFVRFSNQLVALYEGQCDEVMWRVEDESLCVCLTRHRSGQVSLLVSDKGYEMDGNEYYNKMSYKRM